jgi:acetyltransferase
MKKESIQALLRPSSVAIVGATPGDGRGGWIHEQLLRHGYDGPIYPVNPKYAEIRGARAYPTLLDIPGPVEFVAVALGAGQAISTIEQCAQKGVRAALFVASGFAEAGPAGQAIQAELRRVALAHGIAVCGPNCYGVANLHGRFAAYGGALTEPLRRGPIALLFQSGALTHSAMDPVAARTSGYSYIVTTGNEAVVELADYVAALADDPHTRVIACFAEGLKSPARFFTAARAALARGKRMVVLKTGRSELARRAALAHTGALTGPDDAYDALFRQLGIARVPDLDELIETAELLAQAGPDKPGAAAIITISGGSCGVAADLAQSVGLALAPLAEATTERLRAILPPFASPGNPLDLTGAIGGDPALLPGALDALAADEHVGALALALNTPIGGDQPSRELYQLMCRAVAERAAAGGKLHMVFSISSGAYDPEVVAIASAAGLPLLQGMRESLAALAHWQRAAVELPAEPDSLAGPPLAEAIALVRRSAEATLGEHEAKAVLAAAGLPVAREVLAATADEAVAAAEAIGYPVALKISSPDLPHKTEAGGVRLGLVGPEDVRAAFEQIVASARAYRPDARIDGALVQQQVPGGLELLVGVVNHAGLGPVVVAGLGGVLVEALGDRAVRAAPFDVAEARAMIAETRAGRLLAGWRGGPPLDADALALALARVSRLAWELRDEVAAIDINPLIVLPQGHGVAIVDALIVRAAGNTAS